MLSKEERLRSAVQYIASRDEAPAFSAHTYEVMRAVDEGRSTEDIAALIERSVALTTAILKQANSTAVNKTGRRVIALPAAVGLLGNLAVRNLVATFLNRPQPRSTAAQDLLLKATLTANLARQLAARPKGTPDSEAYVCGMLRNLGELMAALHLPALHQEVAARQSAGEPRDRACQDILSFTYEELGQRVAKVWNLHDYIVRTISSAKPRAIAGSALSFLHGVTSFAFAVSETLDHAPVEEVPDRLVKIRYAYKTAADLDTRALQSVIDTAYKKTREVWAEAAVPLDNRRIEKRIRKAMEASASGDNGDGPSRESALTPLREAVSLIRGRKKPSDVNAFTQSVLETMLLAGTQRALLALRDNTGATITGRLGAGEEIGPFLEQFRYSSDAYTNPIAFALARRRELYLDESATTHLGFLRRTGAQGALILPLVVNEEAVGCLYTDWNGKDGIAAPDRDSLRELRDLCAQAIAVEAV
ncbi:MAG: HDOD domain-containing protein [Bryobacteraceae bacterium]|nr:HDOD domain-containing protein [Bryobacteraceae bacterium]